MLNPNISVSTLYKHHRVLEEKITNLALGLCPYHINCTRHKSFTTPPINSLTAIGYIR